MSVNNISANMIVKLREEMLLDIRETENKIIEEINKKWSNIENTNKSFLEKVDLMMENNKKMFDSITLQKMKLEKISDYEPFKNKIEYMVTTHEMRINSIMDGLYNVKTRYDKIFENNLTVPGFIGPACRHKTISDYLLNHIMENSRARNEREILKYDVKECKSRIEGFLKKIITLNDNAVNRCNQYADTKEKIIKEYVDKWFESFHKKFMDLRAGLYDKQMKMFQEIKEYTKEFEGILEMKKDIDLAIDSKLKEKDLVINKINEKIEEKGNKINSLINDFIRYNKALNDINITMKEIQFKENTNKMDIIKINSKLKKKNEMQDNGEKINNTLDNERKINNNINDNINKKNSYEQSINYDNISPIKNEKLPNEGINLFKESLMKGKTLLNKRSAKDNIFYIRKKKSEKLILEQKEKSKNSEKEIDNKEHTSNEVSYTLLYNNTINQKNMINNKFDFSISSIKNKLLKNNVTSTENNMNKETIESTENKKQMSFKRNSNSDYKSKKNNQNYSNMFKINNIKKSQINYKMHKFKEIVMEKHKTDKMKALSSDGFITSSPKIAKKYSLNTFATKPNSKYHNSNKNVFNYKIIEIGDKVTLDSETKEYPLDLEKLIKRSIRINLVSPLSNVLKTYRAEKNRKNINKEVNIKVNPAFGSTAYSFYRKKDFPNINTNS
jgi:hypothetical protein